jgi:hypothetical protein
MKDLEIFRRVEKLVTVGLNGAMANDEAMRAIVAKVDKEIEASNLEAVDGCYCENCLLVRGE